MKQPIRVHAIVGFIFMAMGMFLLQQQHPKPPGPGPDPMPVPVPGEFRAILAFESSGPMSRDQLAALYSVKAEEYLKAKAKDWRRWDKDVDVSKAAEPLRTLWTAAKPKLQVPCIVVGSGSGVEVVPLTNEAELLKTLAKYGG